VFNGGGRGQGRDFQVTERLCVLYKEPEGRKRNTGKGGTRSKVGRIESLRSRWSKKKRPGNPNGKSGRSL